MATTAPSPATSGFLPGPSSWTRADTAPTALSEVDELQARSYGSLSEPIPYEACSSGSDDAEPLRWGVAAEQGQRANMEDTHLGIVDLEGHLGKSLGTPGRTAFFGVYDGHSGRSAAEFARDQLLNLVAQQSSFPQQLTDALRSAYLAADEQLFSSFTPGARAAGCTALTALVWGRHIAMAHAGDSRAVLCRRGKAIDLTTDHKPTVTSERDRVFEAGGHICGASACETYLCGGICSRKSALTDISAASAYENSHVGVTRALGDFHLKQLKYKSSDGTRWQGPLIAEPEVRMHELSAEDEFIILACDGLWDVVTSQRAVELARSQLRMSNSPEVAAQSLIQHAMERHASDNVTVLIVGLSSRPPPTRSFSRRSGAPLNRILSNGGLHSLAAALAQASE